MKRLLIIAICLVGLNSSAQFIFTDNDRDTGQETLLSTWTDPTLSDSGFQQGVEITKELMTGWVSLGVSNYLDLDRERVPYTDLVASGGLNWHMFSNDVIKYYGGGRGGIVMRGDKQPHVLVGLVIGFDIKLDKRGLYRIGTRLWVDWRQDQKDQFFGDSDAFEPGILFKNPISQENGAVVLTIKLN